MIFTESFLAALSSAPDVDVRIVARVDVESGCDSELELKIAHTDVRVKLCDIDEPTGREILAWVSACEDQVQDYLLERLTHEREEKAFRAQRRYRGYA